LQGEELATKRNSRQGARSFWAGETCLKFDRCELKSILEAIPVEQIFPMWCPVDIRLISSSMGSNLPPLDALRITHQTLPSLLKAIDWPLLPGSPGSCAPPYGWSTDGSSWSAGARLPPLPWFLPGSKRIRGGAAREFSSVWPFHRGIHPEATCAGLAEISTHFQGLAQPALRERWIPEGIQGSHPVESRDRGSHATKPPSPCLARRR
jgi:hypothetical protein